MKRAWYLVLSHLFVGQTMGGRTKMTGVLSIKVLRGDGRVDYHK